MNFSDYTHKEESAYTYYAPSSSGVLHLANKGEVEARSKAVLEEYRRAWAEEFPLGYDGYPVSKNVCLIHVMGWEDDGSALKEQGLPQELRMVHDFWQSIQDFFCTTACTHGTPHLQSSVQKTLFAHMSCTNNCLKKQALYLYSVCERFKKKKNSVHSLKPLTWAVLQQKIPDRSPRIWINSRSGLIQDHHFCFTNKSNGNRQFPLHSTYKWTETFRNLRWTTQVVEM